MGYAEQEAQTPRLLAEIERLKKIIKANEPKRPMTIEEMDKRWPECPPSSANSVEFWSIPEFYGEGGTTKRITFEINQDTIGEIRDYVNSLWDVS